jgi:hypothetical protein
MSAIEHQRRDERVADEQRGRCELVGNSSRFLERECERQRIRNRGQCDGNRDGNRA